METNNPTKKIFCGSTEIWGIFFLLAACSLIAVFSATSTIAYSPKNTNIWAPIMRHASFLFGGFLLVLFLAHTHYKYFSLAILLLPISIGLLFATFFIGISVHGASRFLPLLGFQFQPSEIGKLACIVYVAFLLSRRREFSDDNVFKWIVWGVAAILVLIFPFNLSTTVLLGCVCFLLMFIGQISFRKLGKLLFWVVLLSAVFVFALYVTPQETVKKYLPRALTWQSRVHAFFGSKKAGKTYIPTEEDYQITHAKAAIASGAIWGKGPGRSEQRNFLPQAYSDFIYAIIIEELGVFFGGLGVLILYIWLMVRVGIIARKCKWLFPKYLALGCGLMIVIQALVHMAVNVGMIPVTGQPLPLISLGGTSTLLTCAYIGIILSISHYGAEVSETDEVENEEENLPAEIETDSEKKPIFAAKSTVSEQ
ncbi:MAG: FtsW/RodA/SpoVE family cell cycle protein [Tannerella sp.]|jgi:cell division protein FtsW|nr:FtsW/RodA/SpoVE family cell cycle protein [Tannerella sp.]